MMALSVNAPSEIFESAKDEADLEDGEIEDDEEEVVKTQAPVAEKVAAPPKKPSPLKLEPPIIEASAVASAKLLVTKNKESRSKEERRPREAKESKKHSKKHSSRNSKVGAKQLETPKSKQNLAVEDDWADNIERAIRKAMGRDGSMAKDTHPAKDESLHQTTEFRTEEERNPDLSGEDRKSKKKKRKKKHRDEDGEERKESKRRKKHHHKEEREEEGEDDDEMLFVRGASPINVYHGDKRHVSQSPPPNYRDDPYLYPDDVGGQFEEPYDSYEEDSEMDDYMLDIEGGPRSRGRGIKRGRGRGGLMRGLMRKGLRPRDLMALKKRKRLLQPRHPDQRPDSVCMFFMQGKCQKGDDCPYSHDALPPRKMELCKFYLMDCCAKKDKCLYMHHDFPCKFHHTGLKCYAGDRCKFSHGPLNDILKNILLRHLETAPKEILGDFPRLSREGAAAMVHNKKTRDHTTISAAATGSKSIPSLFDIEVPVPLQFMGENENEDEGSPTRKTTPMPSDNEDQDVNNENSPTSKPELRSPGKHHKRGWENGEEPASKSSRHLDSKAHWDEEIRKHQEQLQHEEEDELARWNESRHRERGDSESRWSNESKQFEEAPVVKKKRRLEREKKPRWEEDREEREAFGRRRDEDRRRREPDERRRRRPVRDMSGGFAEEEEYAEEQVDPRKSMRFYRDDREEDRKTQRKTGFPKSRGSRHQPDVPRPLDLDTDAEDKDDLVMDVDDHDTGRKESVDEAALVIDTREEEDDDRKWEDDRKEHQHAESEPPMIPLHIQKLPKKQQELFLRIQQQQREQENSQGSSVVEDKDEDHQDERWYSSDDDDETEETTLTDVLKKLSATKVPDPDPDLAKKVTDLTKVPDVSEAVNKLLTSIGMRTQPENKTDKPKPSSTLPTLPLPPLPLPQPSTGPRDPRLSSRDPRNRQESSETRTSQDSPTPSSSSTSSTRGDPRARRRSSCNRSIYDSISLSGPDKPADTSTGQGIGSMMSPLASSILTTKPGLDVNTDVDLRRMLGGLPFKPVPQHTAATEIDARLNSHPAIPYRVSVISVPTPDYTRLKVSSTDPLVRVDPRLRKLFKITSSSPASPPPVTPTLASPTPSSSGAAPPIRADPRRLASQSRSAVTESQEQIQPDPKFHQRTPNEMMGNSDPFSMQGNNVMGQQAQYARNELLANPMLLQQMLPTLGIQNNQGMLPMQNIDPRMFRNAPQTPGLLGDAPFYSNMPRYDEPDRDAGNGSDSDQRQFYQGSTKRMGSTMEMQEWEQQQKMMDDQPPPQHMYRNSNRGNWRGHPARMNSRYHYDKRNANRGGRSYTPPPV